MFHQHKEEGQEKPMSFFLFFLTSLPVLAQLIAYILLHASGGIIQ